MKLNICLFTEAASPLGVARCCGRMPVVVPPLGGCPPALKFLRCVTRLPSARPPHRQNRRRLRKWHISLGGTRNHVLRDHFATASWYAKRLLLTHSCSHGRNAPLIDAGRRRLVKRGTLAISHWSLVLGHSLLMPLWDFLIVTASNEAQAAGPTEGGWGCAAAWDCWPISERKWW